MAAILNTQPPVASVDASAKSNARILAEKALEKFDQHVIGRISAVAQIPFHTIGLMAQVLKVIARYPVCLVKDRFKEQNDKDAMLPVKKDFLAAYIIFKRIGRNFRDMFYGSRAGSTTFVAAVVNTVTVPLASTFLTQEGFLDYQATELGQFGPREKVSEDEMVRKLLPNSVEIVTLDIDSDEAPGLELVGEEFEVVD